MDQLTQARYSARARILKALAHPTRLFIVDTLAEAEHCVCELTTLIGVDTSTVSKHLAVLKNAGVVDDEKRGNLVYYRLRTPCVRDFIACAESVMRADLERQLDALG